MFWRKSGLGHEPKLASSADHSASGAPCRSAFTAHQLHRMVGVTYKTAWFLAHRIRESMGDTSHKSTGGLGGANKVVESGRNLRRRQSQEPRVQRTGPEESRRLACRARRTCRFVLCRQRHGKERAPLIVTNANRPSTLMTDDSAIYPKIGDEFENHHSVNHSANEYARLSGYVHTNSERRSFIGISPNSTSAITTVAASALKTPSAPQKRSGAAKASG
jgi:hypothetical protein